MLSPQERLYFWTGIMRDHAEFMLMSLSSREKEPAKTVQTFKNAFTELHEEAKELAAPEAVMAFAKKTEAVLTRFIELKKVLLKRLLQCNIELNFPPTFVNHMINEAGEFQREIDRIQVMTAMDPVKETIMLHLIWLPDAAGHAATIASDLDPTEAAFIKQAQEFKKDFNNLYLKAIELGLQLDRASLEDGALEWFSLEVAIKMNEFIGYLDKVRELRQKCQLLGDLNPLIPDHMIREEKYYLANVESIKK